MYLSIFLKLIFDFVRPFEIQPWDFDKMYHSWKLHKVSVN